MNAASTTVATARAAESRMVARFGPVMGRHCDGWDRVSASGAATRSTNETGPGPWGAGARFKPSYLVTASDAAALALCPACLTPLAALWAAWAVPVAASEATWAVPVATSDAPLAT